MRADETSAPGNEHALAHDVVREAEAPRLTERTLVDEIAAPPLREREFTALDAETLAYLTNLRGLRSVR